MRINLPNQITIGRFFLAIIFLILLNTFDCRSYEQNLWMLDVCLILFVIAASSDWLDGYLARKHNQVTSFGRILDPFADKILIIGGFVLLLGSGFRDETGAGISGLKAWMVLLVIARELLVSGLRGFAEAQGQAYAANWWGKIKMILQCITLGWILLSLGRGRDIEWFVACRPFLIWAMILFTAASVIAYLFASREALSEQSRA